MEQQALKAVPLAQQVSELPPFAMIIFAVTLAVIFGVRYLGLFNGGRAAPEESKAAAPVAAVIVDPSALNRLTAAGEALNMTLMETNKLAREKNQIDKEKNENDEERVRVDRLMATELGQLREEVRITRELNRRER
jgi:hypothetical protein